MARRVVRHLRGGGNVLDVGCGTGALCGAIRVAGREAGKRIGLTVGVDVAEGMAARADRRSGVRAAVGDVLSLPLIDQYFDVVVATGVMQYVEDPDRAVRELYRVAMPGGTIVIELASPSIVRGIGRADVRSLPRWSLLRRYTEMRRSYGPAAIRRSLAELGCAVREVRSPRFRDRLLERLLGPAAVVSSSASLVFVARVPGPRRGGMRIRVEGLPRWTPARVERLLEGLPVARGYEVVVKPLHWRKRPHVAALCEFDRHRITVQVPKPFYPFTEDVPYRAKRIHRRGRWHFRWFWRKLRFERPDELIRYLYLHEYYHWYLREVRGRRSGAETACDRFALQQLGRGLGGYAMSGHAPVRAQRYGYGRLRSERTRLAAKGSRRSG